MWFILFMPPLSDEPCSVLGVKAVPFVEEVHYQWPTWSVSQMKNRPLYRFRIEYKIEKSYIFLASSFIGGSVFTGFFLSLPSRLLPLLLNAKRLQHSRRYSIMLPQAILPPISFTYSRCCRNSLPPRGRETDLLSRQDSQIRLIIGIKVNRRRVWGVPTFQWFRVYYCIYKF